MVDKAIDKAIDRAMQDVKSYAAWRLERAGGVKDMPLALFVVPEPGRLKNVTNMPRPELGQILTKVVATWELARIVKKQ